MADELAENPEFSLFTEIDHFDFVEASGEVWIPFLPKPGKYASPMYGQVDVTSDFNKQLVASVQNKVYQEHIPLDAEHQTKLSGAVAWLKGMRQNVDGSGDALVEWTKRGASLLADKAYKYISPEWYTKWRDPASGAVLSNVIVGGALTTRPFFKEKSLRALVASERGVEIVHPEPDPYWFKEFTKEQRDALAEKGAALPDGSFPIETATDVTNAVHDWGRAGSSPSAKAHIKKMAAEIGCTDQLPEDWSETPMADKKTTAAAAAAADADAQDEADEAAAEAAAKAKPAFLTKKATEVPAPDQTQAFTEKISKLEGELETAKTVAASEKTLREQTTTRLEVMEKKDRHQHFAEIVDGRGRGATDGAAKWAGEPDKQIMLLEKMSEAFGEDSEELKTYIELQSALSAQVAEGNLFKELGSSAGNAPTDPERRLTSMAEQLVVESGKSGTPVDFAEAYDKVLATPAGSVLYGQMEIAKQKK
jgi:hypothetical protein